MKSNDVTVFTEYYEKIRRRTLHATALRDDVGAGGGSLKSLNVRGEIPNTLALSR